jgi:hypothetical protein
MKPLLPLPSPPWSRWHAAAGFGVAALALTAAGPAPAAAQSAEDWSTAPLTLPTDPAGAPAGGSPVSAPPPRQILQPPPELRRPQAPLQPDDAPPPPARPLPSVRILPGAGVQPAPPRPPAAAAPSRLPARPAAAPARLPTLPARPAPATSPAPTALAPTAADLERIRASLRQSRLAMPKPAVPNYLQSLPPGTLRPLPGEVLPGSRPPGAPTLPPGAAPSPLQGLPPPPLPPQAVPPPPWLNPKPETARTTAPWAWLLLGLGIGATGVVLVQDRRRQPPGSGPLEALGIRVVARPDPGTQTLRPQERAGATPGE